MAQRLKIAVLDSKGVLRRSLGEPHANCQHDMIHVVDTEDLDDILARNDIQTVVLGNSLDIEDSVRLAKRLRSARPSLILVLLIDTDSQDLRIKGYNSGADVCISGASQNAELMAVIQSISQRLHVEQMHSASITLNCSRREIKGTNVVTLNVVELTLLKALVQAPDKQMPYFRMLELFDTEVDTKAKAALEVHVARLRKKLIDAGAIAPAIRAIRNEGYQLIESVRVR